MATWAPQVSDVQTAIQYSSAGMGGTSLNTPVITWTNEIVQEILGEMKWTFTERSTTTTTTANQRYVDVPANAIIGIRAIRDTTNDYWLTQTTKEEVYAGDSDPDNATAGDPESFYAEWTSGTAARIYGDIPFDAAVTLALDYWYSGDEITAASDLIPLPGVGFSTLKTGVLYLAKEYQRDPGWEREEERYRMKLAKLRGRPMAGKGYIQLRPMG